MSRDYENKLIDLSEIHASFNQISFEEQNELLDLFCNELGGKYGYVDNVRLQYGTVLENIQHAGALLYQAIKERVKYDFEEARDRFELKCEEALETENK